MKKIIKTGMMMSVLSVSILANAEYIMKIPVEADIRFVPANTSEPEETETPVVQEPVIEETWTTEEPVISEWINSGDPYDCNQWIPETNSFSTGKEFTQSTECRQNQTRTIQYYERSNTGLRREFGEQGTETQVVFIEQERNSVGSRYTHVLKVGKYEYGGSYNGYFSDDYISRYHPVETEKGSITPNTFKGYTIDHFVETNERHITFRLLPAHQSPSINPIVTLEGKDCYLTGPDIYSAYNALCGYELHSKVGQTLYLDIR